MKNMKKDQMMMSNTHMIVFVVVALLAAAFLWKVLKLKMRLKQPMMQTEVSDSIEGKSDLAQTSTELDAVNVDGSIDPELAQVNADVQQMK